MIVDERLSALNALFPELRRAPEPLADRIASEALPLEAPRGKTLFEPSDPCRGFPLLLEGKVRVARPARDGSELFLYRLRPGELCAMTTLALLASRPYRARAITEATVRGLVLPRPLALELIEEVPRLHARIYLSLARQTDRLIGRLEEVTRLGVEQRLASRLISEGPLVHATHQELAEELDCSREMVSRILSRFQREGLVGLQRGRVEILDTSALEDASES